MAMVLEAPSSVGVALDSYVMLLSYSPVLVALNHTPIAGSNTISLYCRALSNGYSQAMAESQAGPWLSAGWLYL
jgi:hypothetical protein